MAKDSDMAHSVTEAKINIGETYIWELESNPSTGYGWYFKNIEEGLTVESEFITKSDLCGAPGIQRITVKATIAGEYKLVADYTRPWENCEPIDYRTLILKVN